MIAWRTIISRLSRPIFTIFLTNDRYLFIDVQSGPLFPIPQRTLPWQPIWGKISKLANWRSETDRSIADPIPKYSVVIL